ncbi:MAG: hypothetical protein NZ840_12065 [Anaerolineales bacterium]|nr:hypothetical protein [Anaerolineales bacterium]MDW8162770.1 hypothetical protein [Anaerolineales bacterium]
MNLNRILNHWTTPVWITSCLCLGLIAYTLVKAEGDIFQFILIGTRFAEGDPQGSEGYDGQFGYYIALDPDPQEVKSHLDRPAYRYQRILLPLLARVLSLGNWHWIPWWLVILPFLGQVFGVLFVAKVIEESGRSPLLALIYGLNAGALLSIRVALPEPLAYGFVAAALYAYLKRKYWLGAAGFACAFFAKEVTLVFGGAVLVSLLLRREWKASAVMGVGSFLPFGLWQAWLWRTFGEVGLGSGGEGATGFELLPFGGLLRIANYSLLYFLGMLVVFSPLVILPSIWGFWVSLRRLLSGDWRVFPIALFLHSLMMFFLPFSTYRETGGILRLSVGFVLAFLLYVATENVPQRLVRYLPFWLVYNVFLLR